MIVDIKIEKDLEKELELGMKEGKVGLLETQKEFGNRFSFQNVSNNVQDNTTKMNNGSQALRKVDVSDESVSEENQEAAVEDEDYDMEKLPEVVKSNNSSKIIKYVTEEPRPSDQIAARTLFNLINEESLDSRDQLQKSNPNLDSSSDQEEQSKVIIKMPFYGFNKNANSGLSPMSNKH